MEQTFLRGTVSFLYIEIISEKTVVAMGKRDHQKIVDI
jgi:hypothetical protein